MIASLESRDIAGVVLDIEGTTTPVSFVYDVLFPYARERLASYVASNHDSDEFDEIERALRAEWTADAARNEPVPPWLGATSDAPIVSYLRWLMDRDRKSTPLKAVQGRIWEVGFRDGALRGQVYPDVPRAFDRWRAAGVSISIYSSGSVLSQRLLFRHSEAGDLTPYLGHYFDTAVGAKRDPVSYERIAAELAEPAERLLFISDVQEELDAATASGFQTLLCVREPDSTKAKGDETIHSFDEVT